MTDRDYTACGDRGPSARGARLLVCDLPAGHDPAWHETISAGDEPVRWAGGGRLRTWALPPEPGPEVKAVRDERGLTWRRGSPGSPWGDDDCNYLPHSWGRLLAERGPVTEVVDTDALR